MQCAQFLFQPSILAHVRLLQNGVNSISQNTPRPTNIPMPDYASQNTWTLLCSQSSDFWSCLPVPNHTVLTPRTHCEVYVQFVCSSDATKPFIDCYSLILNLFPGFHALCLCSVSCLLIDWPKPVFDPDLVFHFVFDFLPLIKRCLTAITSVSALSYMI